jgi:hypothetical protein
MFPWLDLVLTFCGPFWLFAGALFLHHLGFLSVARRFYVVALLLAVLIPAGFYLYMELAFPTASVDYFLADRRLRIVVALCAFPGLGAFIGLANTSRSVLRFLYRVEQRAG